MPIHTLKLLKNETVANNTIKLTFEKPQGMNFIAGQYGGFTLIKPSVTDDLGINRRFSILSAPDDKELQIVTRIQTSAFKKNLQKMAVGDEIKFAGPSGNFVLHDDHHIPAVMIAGGIGIAPFYSMIKHALNHIPEQQMTLFYGNQTLADSAFMEELHELENNHPQFKMIAALANPNPEWKGSVGFITDELIVKNVPDLDKPVFYVCGSPAMVAALHQVLRELDIPEERIKVEDFPG
ncbi:MAG TPA: FAD-dependent oxidoreductase, partial [Gammaproteobacteria bacterium]|nr:FAD-dependent oxidoreductase [Gammaproteobacteria bacterium]